MQMCQIHAVYELSTQDTRQDRVRNVRTTKIKKCLVAESRRDTERNLYRADGSLDRSGTNDHESRRGFSNPSFENTSAYNKRYDLNSNRIWEAKCRAQTGTNTDL